MRQLSGSTRRGAGFDTNLAHWRGVLDGLHAEEASLRAGGGEKAAARQTSQGKMLVRERLRALLDPGTPFLELGVWAGWGMYRRGVAPRRLGA